MTSAVLISSLAGTFVPVAAAGPLSISNVDSPDPVQSGDQILYTITVMNTGGASVNNIVLTDQINGVVGFGNPPLLDVVSSQGSCSQTNTQVTCTAGTLGGRGVWTVTIRGRVTAAGGTTINNIATVVATKSAQTYTTSAAATTQVQGSGPGGPSPDLTIAKNGPLHVTPNSTITYTLTVNNIGNANALGVKVTDTIPALVTITGVVATSLFSCPAPYVDNTVVCTGGRVNAGANATITVNGTVPASGAGSLENTSAVDPDDTIDEGILGDTADAAELNNFSNTVVTNVSPNPPNPPPTNTINIDKQGPLSAIPNQLITYTIVVSNGSLGRADYITMTDGTQGLHAASLRVVSAASTSGTNPICVVAAPTVECTMTRLGTGGTMTVVIEGMVIASAGSTIINSAAVNANIKNKGYTARDEVQTIINAGIDLTITKSDEPDPVCASSFPPTVPVPTNCRGGLTYTFVVGNSGVNPATNVVVRDPLPPGTTYDDAATDAANALLGLVTCNEIPVRVVRCVIPSLAGGATQTIKVVLAAPPTLGTITNTVTVDPSNAIFEADETNNIAVQTTTVATGIDLTIVKDDETNDPGDAPPNFNVVDSLPGFDPIATNGTQTYRITVDNTGTQNVTGIHVRDILPAGTIFLAAEEVDINGAPFPGLHGFTCTHDGSATGGVVDCIGGSLLGTADELYFPPAPGEDRAYIEIKIFARPTVGIMHNEVRVDPLNVIAEYDESDNIEFEDTAVVTGNGVISAFNQLRITKTQVSPVGTVATNGTVTYNLHVENLGTDPVSAVVVQDFLPTGSRFISAADTDVNTVIGVSDAFLCSHDGSPTGGTITCTGGAFSGSVNTILEDDGTTAVPIARDIRVVMFAPNTPGTYPNISKVDPNNVVPEGNEFDNTSTINTPVGIGGALPFNELNLTKQQTSPTATCAGIPCVATSSVVEYTIVVKNDGSDVAFQVRVRDTLPSGFTFISADDTIPGANAFQCAESAGVVNCSSAMIAGGGATRTILLRAFSASAPGDYTNQVAVDPDNNIPEGNETNNTAQATTRVRVGAGFVDLSVKKCDVAIVAGCEPPAAPATKDTGGLFTYFLEVTNNGSNPAFNVNVQDVLPVGVTYVSATDDTTLPGDFICSALGFVVTCSGGTLDGTGNFIPDDPATLLVNEDVPTTRTISIVVRAPSQHNVVIFNQAFIDPGNAIAESNETNNQAFEVTSIQSPFNLKLDKDGPDQANQNSEENYVITVTNLGAAVNDVVVLDALPVGLIPLTITATPSNFICELTENPVNGVRCVGDMGAAGAADNTDVVTITIGVFVTQNGGTLDNEACVDPDNNVIESNEGDNCDTKTTDVVKFSPNLSVQKSGPSSATAGETITYTVSVSNIGDAPAAEPVTITDELPDAVSIVGTPVATNGFVCTHDGSATGGDVTCTDLAGDDVGLAVGAFTQITIQVRVNDDANTPFTNTAHVPAGTAYAPLVAPCDAVPTPCENETAAHNTNNSDSVTTSVGGSAIDLIMGDITDVFDPSNIGDSLTYTFTVTNGGSQNALAVEGNEVVIRVDMPTVGVTFTSGIASQGFVCAATNSNALLTCTGDLDAGESTTATIEFAVSAATPPKLTLQATVDPADDIVETNEANNFAVEDTTVNTAACNTCIDLVMGQIFASPNPVEDGGQTTYSFTVTNIGDLPTLSDSDPNDVQIRIDLDTIFEDSTFVSFTATADFSCSQPFLLDTIPSTDILCTNTTTGLNAGQGTLITITVDVDTSSTPSFVDFDVTVDPADMIEEDPFEFNNTGGLRIDVVAP